MGDGAWGTAVATLLAHNGYQVNYGAMMRGECGSDCTYAHNERYLPGHILSEHIIPTTSLEDACACAMDI